MFEPQLGKNIEVYIDNMVIKIKVESEHVNDLGNIFAILRKHRLRLNASKCRIKEVLRLYGHTPWNRSQP